MVVLLIDDYANNSFIMAIISTGTDKKIIVLTLNLRNLLTKKKKVFPAWSTR